MVDQTFFQAWFRGKYASSIRPGKIGSENQDFELIGSRFHNWFKDNHKKIFSLDKSDQFYSFFKNNFPFFVKNYIKILDSKTKYDSRYPHLHYVNYRGIADSLQDALLLSSINYEDNEEIINKKIDFTARFIETFTVKRAINYRKFGQATIKYTIFTIIKLIRNNDLVSLGGNLINEINNIDQQRDGINDF
jgi:hypothetical protein